MILSLGQFRHFQSEFLRKVIASPYQVVFKEYSVLSGTVMETFFGDSDRVIKRELALPCLYEKFVNNREREKVGLPTTVDGVIYFSPLQLVPLFDTFKLNINSFVFEFQGRTQVVENVTYMEEIFNSCIAVRFGIRDNLKGG